jgi:2-(3-amino-3-carboxypropyl)histidine synthase
VDTTTIKTLYVFVEIAVDRAHLAASIRLNFPQCIPAKGISGSSKGKGPELEIAIEPSAATRVENSKRITKLAVVGTIQFVAAVQGLKGDLESDPPIEEQKKLAITEGSEGIEETDEARQERVAHPKFEVVVPQVKPLSPGEILGCTAPRLSTDTDALMFVSFELRVMLRVLTTVHPHSVMSVTDVSILNQL